MADNFSYFELNDDSGFKKYWNKTISSFSQDSIRWSIIIGSLIIVLPTLLRGIMLHFGFHFPVNTNAPSWLTNENIDYVLKTIYSLGLFACLTVLLMGLILGRIKLKSRLDNIDTICALFSILMFIVALFFPQIAILFILLIWINLYCFMTRLVEQVNNKFKSEDNPSKEKSSFTYEKFFFWAIPLSLVLYFLSYQADITLNEIFKVDPKHFTNTKPFAMLIELAPYLMIFTGLSLIILSIFLINQKENNQLISYFSYLFSCLILMAISMIFIEDNEQVIRKYADTVDFNPKNVCNVKLNLGEKQTGTIYLDPSYNTVLLSIEKKDSTLYSDTFKCNLFN